MRFSHTVLGTFSNFWATLDAIVHFLKPLFRDTEPWSLQNPITSCVVLQSEFKTRKVTIIELRWSRTQCHGACLFTTWNRISINHAIVAVNLMKRSERWGWCARPPEALGSSGYTLGWSLCFGVCSVLVPLFWLGACSVLVALFWRLDWPSTCSALYLLSKALQ